jgi:hypothetical protein
MEVDRAAIYRPRRPRASPLWQCVNRHLPELRASVAALGMWRLGPFGSFSLGIAMILFLVVGIRNAWDLILWFAQQRKP